MLIVFGKKHDAGRVGRRTLRCRGHSKPGGIRHFRKFGAHRQARSRRLREWMSASAPARWHRSAPPTARRRPGTVLRMRQVWRGGSAARGAKSSTSPAKPARPACRCAARCAATAGVRLRADCLSKGAMRHSLLAGPGVAQHSRAPPTTGSASSGPAVASSAACHAPLASPTPDPAHSGPFTSPFRCRGSPPVHQRVSKRNPRPCAASPPSASRRLASSESPNAPASPGCVSRQPSRAS